MNVFDSYPRRSNTVYIYALIDPRTNLIRYIGKSVDVKTRYNTHISDSELSENNHRTNWLRNLLSSGTKPLLEIIEETVENNWEEREIYWINYYRERGYPLVNMVDGGIAPPVHYGENNNRYGATTSPMQGKKHSKASIEKMSLSKRGKSASDETKMKLSIIQRGVNNPFYGKKHTDETRAKISRAVLDSLTRPDRITNRGKFLSGYKKRNNSSMYMGVSYNKYTEKWVCRIRVRGSPKYIGCYDDEVLAAQAYDNHIVENNLDVKKNFGDAK